MELGQAAWCWRQDAGHQVALLKQKPCRRHSLMSVHNIHVCSCTLDWVKNRSWNWYGPWIWNALLQMHLRRVSLDCGLNFPSMPTRKFEFLVNDRWHAQQTHFSFLQGSPQLHVIYSSLPEQLVKIQSSLHWSSWTIFAFLLAFMNILRPISPVQMHLQ